MKTIEITITNERTDFAFIFFFYYVISAYNPCKDIITFFGFIL
jgi:hypothetical protein